MTPLAILGLGPLEIAVLFLVILIIFGAGKIPQIGSSLGKGLKNFRDAVKGSEDDSESESEKKAPQKDD